MTPKERKICGLVLTINKIVDGRKVSYEKFRGNEYGIFYYKYNAFGGYYAKVWYRDIYGTPDKIIGILENTLKNVVNQMVDNEVAHSF